VAASVLDWVSCISQPRLLSRFSTGGGRMPSPATICLCGTLALGAVWPPDAAHSSRAPTLQTASNPQRRTALLVFTVFLTFVARRRHSPHLHRAEQAHRLRSRLGRCHAHPAHFWSAVAPAYLEGARADPSCQGVGIGRSGYQAPPSGLSRAGRPVYYAPADHARRAFRRLKLPWLHCGYPAVHHAQP